MLVYFMAIWTIQGTFGIFCDHFIYFIFIGYMNVHSPVLVCCTKKNLATLFQTLSAILRAVKTMPRKYRVKHMSFRKISGFNAI
jgi:hypothetical protein